MKSWKTSPRFRLHCRKRRCPSPRVYGAAASDYFASVAVASFPVAMDSHATDCLAARRPCSMVIAECMADRVDCWAKPINCSFNCAKSAWTLREFRKLISIRMSRLAVQIPERFYDGHREV